MSKQTNLFRRFTSTLAPLVCLPFFFVVSPAIASVTLEPLERIDFSGLGHGRIVNGLDISGRIVNSDGTNGSLGTNGVTISGDNLYDDRDWIVAFDTFSHPTSDSDLEDPFRGPNRQVGGGDDGNAALHTVGGTLIHPDLVDTSQEGSFPNSSRFQEALIIQETGRGTNNVDPNFVDGGSVGPDDEGRRPAGSIIFDFEEPISEIGFDLLDVEGPEEFNTPSDPGTDAGFLAAIFDENNNLIARVGFDEFLAGGEFQNTSNPVVFGDNTANRIVPITAQQLSDFTNTNIEKFSRVEINFGGSGAVDNLTYRSFVPPSQNIPEASSVLVWAMLGLTVGGYKRRMLFAA